MNSIFASDRMIVTAEKTIWIHDRNAMRELNHKAMLGSWGCPVAENDRVDISGYVLAFPYFDSSGTHEGFYDKLGS